jgi:hypothetical protein
MFRAKTILPVSLVLASVCVVYLGHFQNGFHFDDIHTITGNPYIRDLHNVPKFFTDTRIRRRNIADFPERACGFV